MPEYFRGNSTRLPKASSLWIFTLGTSAIPKSCCTATKPDSESLKVRKVLSLEKSILDFKCLK